MAWKAGVLGLSVAVAAALAATAELEQVVYQWTDAEGAVRYTAHRERIPGSALANARVIRRDPDTGGVVTSRWGEPPAPSVAARGPAPATRPEPAETLRARTELPAATPALARRAMPGPGVYAIQLEAWSISEWLRPLRDLGLLEGRRLYRTAAEVDGRIWERLRLGFFAGPAEARDALERLTAHFPGAWIDRIGVAEVEASRSATMVAPVALVRFEAPDVFAIQVDARVPDEGLAALERLGLLDQHQLYRTTVKVRGETWERLRLGFFATVSDAQAVLSQLAINHPDAWVARAEPAERERAAALRLALAR
jgi:hypothetical protein